jgi:hypothetical protein
MRIGPPAGVALSGVGSLIPTRRNLRVSGEEALRGLLPTDVRLISAPPREAAIHESDHNNPTVAMNAVRREGTLTLTEHRP